MIREIKILINLYSSFFYKRDPDLFVFGAWSGKEFSDNSKYLYLQCLSENINAVWITKSEEIYSKLKQKNMPVCMYDSEDGINLCKRAKYAVFCSKIDDINFEYIGGAVLINLWHGIPIKKIMNDDKITRSKRPFRHKLEDFFIKPLLQKCYLVSPSSAITKIYESAFRIPNKRILELGQPRNDVFFQKNYCMSLNYSNYNKVIVYLPTHRNEGRTKMDIRSLIDMDAMEEYCRKNNYVFLYKKHHLHYNEIDEISGYEYIKDLTKERPDPQELLMVADVLISDYSGSYIDYLLLDRPIVFFNYDYEHYKSYDRDFYFKYDDVTPGEKIEKKEFLIDAIDRALNGKDEYLEERKRVRNIFFNENNQNLVCHNIVNAIKKI